MSAPVQDPTEGKTHAEILERVSGLPADVKGHIVGMREMMKHHVVVPDGVETDVLVVLVLTWLSGYDTAMEQVLINEQTREDENRYGVRH